MKQSKNPKPKELGYNEPQCEGCKYLAEMPMEFWTQFGHRQGCVNPRREHYAKENAIYAVKQEDYEGAAVAISALMSMKAQREKQDMYDCVDCSVRPICFERQEGEKGESDE